MLRLAGTTNRAIDGRRPVAAGDHHRLVAELHADDLKESCQLTSGVHLVLMIKAPGFLPQRKLTQLDVWRDAGAEIAGWCEPCRLLLHHRLAVVEQCHLCSAPALQAWQHCFTGVAPLRQLLLDHHRRWLASLQPLAQR